MILKLRTSEYFLKELFSSLKHNIWLTFASVFTVLISLFILGVFSMIVFNLNNVATTLENQVQVSVYLKDDLSSEEIENIKNELSTLNGVSNISFISKEEALYNFKKRLGDQSYLIESLEGTNPLPDSFSISAQNKDMVQTIAKDSEEIDGVDTATYSQDIVDHLFNFTHFVRIIGICLILLLTGAAIFIISNTIRLTIFARRKEIAIMKYVGATDWFIRWPFLLEGIFLGVAGGLLASLLLRIVYTELTAQIYEKMAFFPLVPIYPFLDYLSLGLVLGGILIGSLGSTISLKKFLKV